MKSLMLYICGVATPFIVWMGCAVYVEVEDWKMGIRYRRAWKKFSDEFDRLGQQELSGYKSQWAEDPSKYAHICDDRSRYFTMRWKYGRTTEV